MGAFAKQPEGYEWKGAGVSPDRQHFSSNPANEPGGPQDLEPAPKPVKKAAKAAKKVEAEPEVEETEPPEAA